MKKTKNILAVMMSLLIAFSALSAVCVPASAEKAESGTCGDGLTWTFKDGTLTVSGTGEIEDYLYCYGSTPWFFLDVKEVKIRDGVTRIGENAFYNCTELENVSLPDTLTTIGQLSFYNCTSLKNIYIPENVSCICNEAFCYCTALEEITVDPDNESYYDIDGVLFSADDSDSSGYVLHSGNHSALECYPAAKSGDEYEVPDGIKTLDRYSFCSCGLKKVILPDSLTSIEYAAFENSENLESVVYGENTALKDIDTSAFLGCKKGLVIENGTIKTKEMPGRDTINFTVDNFTEGNRIPGTSSSVTIDNDKYVLGSENYLELICMLVYGYDDDYFQSGYNSNFSSFWGSESAESWPEEKKAEGIRIINNARKFYGGEFLPEKANCVSEEDVFLRDDYTVNSEDNIACSFSVEPKTFKDAVPIVDKYCDRIKANKDNYDKLKEIYAEIDTELAGIGLSTNQIINGSGNFVHCDCFINGKRAYCYCIKSYNVYGAIVFFPEISDNPFTDSVISVPETQTVEYNAKATITATATGVPAGYYLAVYVNGSQVAKGSNTKVSYDAGEVKGNISYAVKIVDADGNIQNNADGNPIEKDGQIICSGGFLAKLIAFIRNFFSFITNALTML